MTVRERRMCSKCGINPQAIDRRRGGRTYFRSKCASCGKKESKKGYLKEYVRTKHCESCGIIPRIEGVLSLDHVDGDRHNNELKNYWTLCLTCHQIKSYIEAKNKQILGLSNKIVRLENKLIDLGGSLEDD